METQSSLFLAIDQGGHASRALIFEGCGQMVAQQHAVISTFEPRAGWVEHDPEELVSQTLAAISGAVIQLGVDRFRLKAALFGDGWPQANTMYANAGTGAFIQRPVAALPIQQDNLLTSVVWSDETQTLCVREGTVNGGGRALTWLNEREGRFADFSDFDNGATHPPLFLNSVGGLGSPFWRTDVAPRFSEESVDYPNTLAAVVESIVFLLVHNAEHMEADAKPEQLLVGGGMASSTRFCQSLADLLQLTVLRSRQTEATAAGLAFLIAEGPADWRVAPSDVFTARENSALAARYRAWLTWIYAVLERTKA